MLSTGETSFHQTFATWLAPTRALASENGLLRVGVETAYQQEWLEQRLGETIRRTVEELAGAPVVLSQRWKDIADGEQVAMIVVGSGLSWSTLLLQF